MIVLFFLTGCAILGQTGVHDALIPLIQDARDGSARDQALQGIVAIAFDESADLDERVKAAQALVQLNALEVKEELRALAVGLLEKQGLEDNRYIEEKEVSDAAAQAYWELKLNNTPDPAGRSELLVDIVTGERSLRGGRYADGPLTLQWAVDQVAKTGDLALLPILEQHYHISEINGADAGAQNFGPSPRFGPFVEAKVKMLAFSSHEDRFDALKSLFDNPFEYLSDEVERANLNEYSLLYWAVEEVYELNTDDAIGFLVDYAVKLQHTYHDERGEYISGFPASRLVAVNAAYRRIVRLLEVEEGWSEKEFRSRGLFPQKYFFTYRGRGSAYRN